MAIIFNQEDVPAEALPGGITRQRLIDGHRIEGSTCRFDRLTLDAGCETELRVAASDIAWGQVLEGTVTLLGPAGAHELSESHVIFLPPGFEGGLQSADGAVLIAMKVPDATRFDPALGSGSLAVRCIDLEAEPMLESEHDNRTRIYVATRKLFGTAALVGELVAFPPGVTSSNHHHQGAEHFQYVLRGEGIVYLNETPHRIRAGDLVYKYDLERHYCENDGDGEMAFVEFFVPGEYETVWVNPQLRCAWSPTGKNVRGGAPTRDIATHTSDGTVYEDV